MTESVPGSYLEQVVGVYKLSGTGREGVLIIWNRLVGCIDYL